MHNWLRDGNIKCALRAEIIQIISNSHIPHNIKKFVEILFNFQPQAAPI